MDRNPAAKKIPRSSVTNIGVILTIFNESFAVYYDN
jgi:hypothetical protein